MVIGIEGYTGAGKTSICRELIERIPHTILLNGGNLYRAIVYVLMQNGKSLAELEKTEKDFDIKEAMDYFGIRIKIENNETMIYVGNKKISEEALQSKEASIAVSTVGGKANNENLFIFARNFIKDLAKTYNVIVSGRSLMQIYPDLDYHFFITASLEERVRRKCIQYNEKKQEDVRKNIESRDRLQEAAGFYKIYDNTIVIDVTECKNVQESTNKVLEQIKLPECI